RARAGPDARRGPRGGAASQRRGAPGLSRLGGGAMTAEIVLQSVVSGLMFGGVIALVAVGVSLIWGVMDVINFAYGEYLMWAMYLTFFLWATLGLEPILSAPINAVVLFVAGVVTYRFVI